MEPRMWNHNSQYHEIVLRSVPAHCRRALDAGCGAGVLAHRLARRSEEVIGIDVDHDTLCRASLVGDLDRHIQLVEGDVMTYPFSDNGFDFIAAVAVLHHMPLRPALARFRDLLRSGGVLTVIGLYRSQTVVDFAWEALGLPASWILRALRGYSDVAAPTRPPGETLREIRSASGDLLPGAVIQRHLLFRYSLIWHKP